MNNYEKYKNARAFVVLLAALITWLLNMKYHRELLDSLIILLIVIVVFYIISTIAIKLFDRIKNMNTSKVIFDNEPNEDKADDENTDDENKDL